MKAFKLFVVMSFLAAMVFSANILQAEDPPCPSDCEGPWTKVTQVIPVLLPECPMCFMEIEYWYREVYCYGQTWFEIQLGSFAITQDCMDAPGCFSFDKMMIYMTQYILHNNPSTPQIVGQCFDYYKVYNVTCWKLISNPTSQFKFKYKICNVDNCCWNHMRICKVGPNQWEEYYLSGQNDFVFCPTEDNDVCLYVCNILYDYYNPRIRGEDEPKPAQCKFNQSTNSSVYPNPAKNSIEIKMIPGFKGEFKCTIYDDIGNELSTLKNILKSEELIFSFDLSKYLPGFYYYFIEKGDAVVSFGKFTVDK